MSGRKRKGGGDPAIDLTSLLDVVFIILMIFMCRQKLLSDKSAGSAEDAAQAAGEYNEVVNDYRYFREAYVSVPYSSEDITKRNIRILFAGETEPKIIEMNGNEVSGSLEELEKSLEDYILANEGCHIILSLNGDDEQILYRDEKNVSGILYELSGRYEDVYIKGHLGETEE